MQQEIWDFRRGINYQAGGVVSRQITKSANGNVTLFAFDKGEGLSEHAAPFDALVQVLEGTAEVTIAGTPHTLVDGQSILMPANELHALQAVTPFKMLLTMIK